MSDLNPHLEQEILWLFREGDQPKPPDWFLCRLIRLLRDYEEDDWQDSNACPNCGYDPDCQPAAWANDDVSDWSIR